jgi:hypothetical protein
MCWRDGFTRTTGWWKAFVSFLKAFSPYAWVLILIVGITSAVLAYKNLSLQQSAIRPEMLFTRADMVDPYDDGILNLGMQNVGTRSAYDYHLTIKTVDLTSGNIAVMQVVNNSNPIIRQGGISASPRLDMSKFLDVMALCVTYSSEDGRTFNDQTFFTFPTMTRGLKKDKGGGGQYLAASVSPEQRQNLEKLEICKD